MGERGWGEIQVGHDVIKLDSYVFSVSTVMDNRWRGGRRRRRRRPWTYTASLAQANKVVDDWQSRTEEPSSRSSVCPNRDPAIQLASP